MMGATVIKLERPREGDPLRYEPPLLPKGRPNSALYTYLNVNKAARRSTSSSVRRDSTSG